MNTTAMQNHADTAAASRSAAAALDDAKTVVSDAGRDLKSIAADESARLSTHLRGWLSDQASAARNAASSIRTEAVAASDRTQRYVRDEPVRSVLIAAAAGALITGLVMALGRRRGV
jgi:ElaB/YqjD/DUF883 family membrane-anchored ribosome-binding protein